ncbi:MAG TPA: molybdopterin cofactor-binding domain-containing protein [Burkholderiaceae bacterium]|jgi:CO/xanthine dehydrogenase Mo-binding subunit|nr:molybdopterin cofactor-binding domain-containing protein [Burkholderiaceae bacterium]
MTTRISAATINVARRDLLKTGGALLVTFSLSPRSAGAAGAKAFAKTVAADQVDGFLSIDAKGQVTVYSGKVDLGTGVQTAICQIAAEELSVPLGRVTVIQGDTLLTPDQGVTFGSQSIQNGGMQIRQAAATARQALLAEGAAKLGLDKDAVVVKDGVVTPKAGGKGVDYAALIGGKDFRLAVDAKAPTKDPKDFTIVGKPIARLDIPDKVTGRFTFMQDFRRKAMLHARVVRPGGMKATLMSWDDSECRKIADYVRAVRKGNFIAVLARSEWGAIAASRSIDVKWSDWAGLPEQAKLWEYVRNTKVARDEDVQKIGDAGEALKTPDARLVAASYDFAIHTHGSIGPSCSVAEYVDGKLTVWSASQQTHLLRRQIATMLGMSPDDIRCIYVEGAGCYGRNGHEDAAADAALIAKEITAPVRVQWMRQDEHGWDPKGPPTLYDYRAALDRQGNVVGWQSEVFLPELPKDIAVALLPAELAGLPTVASHPGNIHGSLAIPYTFPNIRATAHWLTETPFRPSWIRTPGRMQNTFGNESFVDEIASAIGVDPFEFHLKNIKDPRGAELLQALAELADWKPRAARAEVSGDIARGRGLAYVKYDLVRTYVGAVADVEVDLKTGRVRVTKFHVAHDCGQIINPDGLRNQIEGNVVQTVSRTLIEELKFDRSRVTSVDWASYPILRFSDVPDIAIRLMERQTEKPWGAGEPSAAVVPAAIANAIHNATGARVRSVPFTPDKVKAALSSI